ncbi:MAG: hypothetical protein ABIQ39_09350, partial [Ilumatobacteraceae bacterium]
STEGLGDLQADPVRGHAMFLSYRDQLRQPTGDTPELRASYSSLATHVGEQYAHMTRPRDQGGMGLTHEVTAEDPYPTAAAMAQDVAGGRIRTLATATTGKHELFSDETNDQFRAVHDVFGHAATGRGFSRHGEEAAFRSHRQMFPPEAHPALTSELRGQNSYLNYGPGGFASQDGNIVGLPKWAEGDEQPPSAPTSRVRRTGAQGRLF